MDIFDLVNDDVAFARYERARSVMFVSTFATMGLLIVASIAGQTYGWPLLWIAAFGFSIAVWALLYFWSALREKWAVVQTVGLALMLLSGLFNLGVHPRSDYRLVTAMLSIVLLVASVWLTYVATKMCQERTRVIKARSDAIVREAHRKADEYVAQIRARSDNGLDNK